jgi:hypothetical protein
VWSTVEEIARSKLGLEGDPVGDFDFCGLPISLPDAEMLNSWRWLREYGVLAVAGGYFDQPPEWIRSVDILDSMVNVVMDDLARREKAKRDA